MFPENREKIEILKKIQDVASSMLKELNLNIDNARLVLPPDFQSTIPELILPFPHDILKPLSTLQIPGSTVQALLQCFTHRINELQQQNIETYKRTCRTTASSAHFKVDLSLIHRIFETRYRNECLPLFSSWVSFAMEKVSQFRQCQHSHSDQKPLFNVEYTPVLEKYFDYNGYPSMSHRTVLAQKSGMTPRQIEVWFQNHRRRSKQEGKVIPRLESDAPLRMALKVEVAGKKGFKGQHRLPTPSDDEPRVTITAKLLQGSKDAITVDIEVPTANQKKPVTFLDDSYIYRPPHAYPTTRASVFPDPFPTSDGTFRFPSPTWRRKPTTITIPSTEIDMDEFAQLFHLKLNFAENSRRRGATPPKNEVPFSQPWFHATVTVAPPAPHPAIVRTPCTPISVSTPSLSIFTPIFGASSLSFSDPTSSSTSKTTARKIRPLPRRPAPQSRNSSYGSRTSSFSSDVSSLSDQSSPELRTPPLLPHLEIPPFLDQAQQQELFDFSQTGLATDYSLSNMFPSQIINLTDGYHSSHKLADTSFLDNTFPDFSHNLGDILS